MKLLGGLLLSLLLLPGCLNGGEPDEGGDATPSPTMSPAGTAGAQAGSTATLSPTATSPAWFESLIAPGPLLSAPERIYFTNGPDLWALEGGTEARQVTRQLRLAAAAGAPDGSRAALVVRTEVGTRAAEEIRLVDSEGALSEPIYGPQITEGPGSEPPIEQLVWRGDGLALALVHADGRVRWLPVDGSAAAREATDLLAQEEIVSVSEVVWAPTGNGLVVLGRDGAGAGKLYAVSLNGDVAELGRDLAVSPSIGVFDWLPVRGRLVLVEDRRLGSNSLAGSIFSVAPDGTGKELLVSGGSFAPVVDVLRMQASPDGRWLAFCVYLPDAEGAPSFLSLWLLEIETGALIEVDTPDSARVTDLWWSAGGLVWRGVDRAAAAPLGEQRYGGSEPFVLGVAVPEEGGGTRVIYQSDPR